MALQLFNLVLWFYFVIFWKQLRTASCTAIFKLAPRSGTGLLQIVRRHWRQIHERLKLTAHFHGRSAVEIARHEKSAVTMLYVLGIFLLCFRPFLVTVLIETAQGYTLSVKIAYDYTTTAVVFLSSSLNSPLYCWRIREIRRAAKKAIQRIRNAVRTIWR